MCGTTNAATAASIRASRTIKMQADIDECRGALKTGIPSSQTAIRIGQQKNYDVFERTFAALMECLRDMDVNTHDVTIEMSRPDFEMIVSSMEKTNVKIFPDVTTYSVLGLTISSKEQGEE